MTEQDRAYSRISELYIRFNRLLYGEPADVPVRDRIQFIGPLIVSSGYIVLSDPFSPDSALNLSHPVKPGQYPVGLWLTPDRQPGAETVVASVVRFSDKIPTYWLTATEDYFSPKTNTETRFDLFGVDSGVGSIMDALMYDTLQEHSPDSYRILSALEEALQNGYQDGKQWANASLSEPGSVNILAFSGGLGDGAFKSYWGLDDDDEVVCLWTDCDA